MSDNDWTYIDHEHRWQPITITLRVLGQWYNPKTCEWIDLGAYKDERDFREDIGLDDFAPPLGEMKL